MTLNEHLFKLINGLAHKNIFLDKFMVGCSKYGPYIFVIAICLFYINAAIKKDKGVREIIVDTIAITVISLIISNIIGRIFYMPRPFVRENVNLLYYHAANASFPSDHSIGTISIAIGINKLSKKFGKPSILLAILVGISRIYVGHHFPIDVIGGCLLVLCVNYLYNLIVDDKISAIYFKIEDLIA